MKMKIVFSLVIMVIVACLLFSACGDSTGLSKTQKEYLNTIMSERNPGDSEAQNASVKTTAAEDEADSSLDEAEVYYYHDESSDTDIYFEYWDLIDDYLFWFYIDGYNDPIYYFFDEEYDDDGSLVFSDFVYFIIDEETGEFIFLNTEDPAEPDYPDDPQIIEETCYICNGEGIENCPFCLGKGYGINQNTPCQYCLGKKTQTCHTCGGAGVIERTAPSPTSAVTIVDPDVSIPFSQGSACPRCNGSKTIACYSCHGTGSISKSVFTPDYGTGSGGMNLSQSTCNICHGRKTVICTLCFGRGTV